MSPDVLMQFGQLGAAGLIGLLWVMERRHAAHRDRQLDEAHRRVVERERDSSVLLDVVRENTRAIASLEAGQRQIVEILRALADDIARRPAPFRDARSAPSEPPRTRAWGPAA